MQIITYRFFFFYRKCTKRLNISSDNNSIIHTNIITFYPKSDFTFLLVFVVFDAFTTVGNE